MIASIEMPCSSSVSTNLSTRSKFQLSGPADWIEAMLAMSPRASFAPHATIASAVSLRSAGVNRAICQLMPRRNVPRGTFGVRAW